ncbi:Vicilin-like seed storage protein [Nymphaea thermarum]|nr:Vicilin-like seed storage protein [Nymphaea thermarum]
MEVFRRRVFVVSLLLLLCVCLPMTMARRGGQDDQEEMSSIWSQGGDVFVLRRLKKVYKTEAGEMSVVRGVSSKGSPRELRIGFITMEPRSLFVPQYMNANLILFVRRGQMKVGSIQKDGLVEKELKTGDVYRISSGSTFYLENISEGQRLNIICSFDTTEALGSEVLQSFFIGGGLQPQSVLAGFDSRILSTAFNVSEEELSSLFRGQKEGPIIYVERGRDEPRTWESAMRLRQQSLHSHRHHDDDRDEDDEDRETEEEEEDVVVWAWRKLLSAVVGKKEDGRKSGTKSAAAADTYNLYERQHDFENAYGWSVAVNENVYQSLRHSDIGVYLVNLTAGSMMAPHLNPEATEYGVVLRGSGSVHIVFPNGSAAAEVAVKEGDVFWVPRFFPFCQVASRGGPLEFFGFTTSARDNQPRFLAGANSVMQEMRGPELAAAMGLRQSELDRLAQAQRQSVILPPPSRSYVSI